MPLRAVPAAAGRRYTGRMLTFLRRSAPTAGLAAVCFLADRVDVARVNLNGGKPRIDLLESYARGDNDGEALKRLGRKFGLGRARCTTLLTPAEYQILQIPSPVAREPDERREEIRAKLQDLIEAPVAHVTFDVMAIPTEALAPGRPQQSFAVVAGNAGIAPKVRLFHEAGVGLKVIDIPETAQRNIARYCEQAGRALAFLTFGEGDGLLTFTCGGELFMFRHIDIGLAALRTDDLERRSSLFDRIGLELQRSLDSFDRQYGFIPLARLLLGPQPVAVPLQGYLKDYLGVTVDVLDLADIFDFPSVPELRSPERQAQCLQSVGAALRVEAVA